MSQVALFEEIGDPRGRRDDDFYRTPVFQTQILLRRLPILSTVRLSVFEPCAGDGAIALNLPRQLDVVTNDIVQRDPLIPDFLLDARKVESWAKFERLGKFDVVPSNPPFNEAFDIIGHSIKRARIGVAMLLRLSWVEPTEERNEWLAAHPPTRMIVMPRYDYRQNGKTDSVTSAWFMWDLCGGTFCQPGIEIVSLAERDELIARYGER